MRLQYINNESNRFQTYVANRVAEIREVRTVNTAGDVSCGLKNVLVNINGGEDLTSFEG